MLPPSSSRDYPVFVVVYSDDFAVAGPKKAAEHAYKTIDGWFGFSKKEGVEAELKIFLSINRAELPRKENGARVCQSDQIEYIENITKRYLDAPGLRRHLDTAPDKRRRRNR